ncbi:MAG: ANTAR domain-containing protein [Mycobacterium sp.]
MPANPSSTSSQPACASLEGVRGRSRAGMVDSTADDRSDDRSDHESDDDGRLTAALAEIITNRAVIEQTKGMLMFIYGVDADAAFEMLRKHSQHQNVKLRHLAEQLSQDLVGLSEQRSALRRLSADGILRSAHERIARREMDGEAASDGRRTSRTAASIDSGHGASAVTVGPGEQGPTQVRIFVDDETVDGGQ